MNNTFRAQCHCGQLSIRFSQAPVAQLVCHCRDCQAVSGMTYAKAAFFKAEEQCAQGEFVAVESPTAHREAETAKAHRG